MKFNPTFLLSLLIVLIAVFTPRNGNIVGNYLDKVVHFFLFALLTYQALIALIDKTKETEIIICCVLFGLISEVIQQYIPGRNMDIYDGIANSLGVASAYFYYKYPTKGKKIYKK